MSGCYGEFRVCHRSTERLPRILSQNGQYVDDYAQVLNGSLDQHPNHKGWVKRGVDEFGDFKNFDRYQVGSEIVEDAFTSTSCGGDFVSNVTFKIWSKTGKKIDGLMVNFRLDIPILREGCSNHGR